MGCCHTSGQLRQTAENKSITKFEKTLTAELISDFINGDNDS